MKCFLSSRRWRCALAFAVILALRVAWCRLLPHDDPEGSNLLVNIAFAAVVTVVYAGCDWCVARVVKGVKRDRE